MKDTDDGQQAALHIGKGGGHPRIQRECFHVVSDEAVEKHHGFGAANQDAAARRKIDEARADLADSGIFGCSFCFDHDSGFALNTGRMPALPAAASLATQLCNPAVGLSHPCWLSKPVD